MNHKQKNTSGLNLLIKDVKGYSQAQEAWRFYNNENVDIESLNHPIIERGIEDINNQCDRYVLIAHDWSLINYRRHTSKRDCIETKRSNSQKKISKGYDLQSALAISDIDGKPITPLVHNLKTAKRVISTYDNNIDVNTTHLKELSNRIKYIKEELDIKKNIVHIIDREADSVGFLRDLEEDDFYIIRAVDRSSVEYKGEKISQKDLSNKIELGKYVKSIVYKKNKKNEKVNIYVNSVDVLITRDTYINEGKKKRRIKGKPVKCRFIVERLVDQKNNIVATWLILSNLKENIDDKTIALWYYYRWKIESYFKLLKSSGFNMEEWQQQTAEAVFRRLLIVSYACLLVWQIEHSNEKNIIEIKKFLVRISGRLVPKKKVSTSSALLAGIWNFFSTMDIIELYDIEKLFAMKKELNNFLGFEF